MTPSETLQAAHAARAMGLSLPSPGYLFGAFFFSLAGFAAWRYGKVVERPRTRWLGAVMMFYPYLVGRTWLLYLVGIALFAAMWWDGRQGGGD
jgi:hypothetical protein